MASKIDNWAVFHPEWVGVDIYEVEDEDGGTVYRAYLNLCLKEGEVNQEMLVTTVATDIVCTGASTAAVRGMERASLLFDQVLNEVSLLDSEGAVIRTAVFSDENLQDIFKDS